MSPPKIIVGAIALTIIIRKQDNKINQKNKIFNTMGEIN